MAIGALAAGVAQWQSRSFPSLRRGFDSLHPLQAPSKLRGIYTVSSRTIVYFGYLGDEETDAPVVRDRLGYMETQLQWLSQLVERMEPRPAVLVAYVAPRAWDDTVHQAIARYRFSVDQGSIEADRRNRFEYPGFRAMKLLARELAPDDLIYYCHSKGIIQLAESKMGLFRLHTTVGLTADLAELRDDPGLNRAGIFPSRWGWCWFNFFWVKAGHMAGRTIEEAADRYHFEALIGDRGDKQAYRAVLPLIDRLPFADSGIVLKPWYRPEETSTPELLATHYRYAHMTMPAEADMARGRHIAARDAAETAAAGPRSLWARLSPFRKSGPPEGQQ